VVEVKSRCCYLISTSYNIEHWQSVVTKHTQDKNQNRTVQDSAGQDRTEQ
jgi:hypothetical protein